MKPILLCWFVLIYLTTQPIWAQSGLKGEYYDGMNFDRKVFTRIDPQISFSWFGRTPAPGMPKSYYSIRWTGKLLAPATGQYVFSAKVDDGIRVWIGNRKIMDSWQLNDSKGIVVSIGLEAGHLYDLRVDYFNDMLEGEIELYWQRPDAKKSILNPFSVPTEPIAAKYFFQKTTPAPITKPPAKPVSTTPVVVATPPKAIPKKPQTERIAKRKTIPSLPQKPATADTVVKSPEPVRQPVSEPQPAFKAGETFVLRNVQFEQSSYVLLPESSTELNKLVQTMKANLQWHIHISGHTDNVGDPRLNLALSEQRAKVVATYLTRQGIADERITTEGFGGKQPIADNTTEGERSKNRRVEIKIE